MSLLLILLIEIPIILCQRDGDVYLTGGSYQWEGRVEMYYSGEWGSISDSDWTDDDATVVCRKLGHFTPGAKAVAGDYFGESSTEVNVVWVECSGSEYNLTDCKMVYVGNRTVTAAHVGVQCQPVAGVYREGDVRLIGGPHSWEGRVEIFLVGEWGSIMDSNWTDNDASVVCRQLQFPPEYATTPCCNSHRDMGNGFQHIYRAECGGSEKNITQCPKTKSIATGDGVVSVQCKPGADIKEGSIRLIGGGYMWEGRVEMFSGGLWTSITFTSYSYYAARTVCQQLGYTGSRRTWTYCCAKYGQGIGPIFFNTPTCGGWEHRISDCTLKHNMAHNYHSEDWSVSCQIDGPEHGDIQLGYRRISDVAVYISGTWQLVADTNRSWTKLNSQVVCRQLGCSISGISISYGQDRPWVPYIMDRINCSGNETKLIDCQHEIVHSSKPYRGIRFRYGWGNRESEDMRLVGGESEREGRLEFRINSNWYTVCGKLWSTQNTAVACRYLGFSDKSTAHFLSDNVVSGGYGPIISDYVNCNGSETRLWPYSSQCYCSGVNCPQVCTLGCQSLSHYHGCSHDHDVGVECKPASCKNGALRLTNGVDETTGCVEICHEERWAVLPQRRWSRYNARVTCNELGFDSYRFWRTMFRRVKTHWFTQYFNCSGSEYRLSLCPNKTLLSYHSYEEVGVTCSHAHCNDGELRLVEGEEEQEGRLEVCFDGRWGTVGSQGWSVNNTQTVCYDLGYSSNGQQIFTVSQSLSKPVYMNDVVCSSDSIKLTDCVYSHYSGDISQITDAALRCDNASCGDGAVRVVEGQNDSHGKLEICIHQRWTAVNGKKWMTNNTRVACKQLGIHASRILHSKTIHTSSKPVWLTEVACSGTEKRLIDCHYKLFYGLTSTSEDIVITCLEETTDIADDTMSTKVTDQSQLIVIVTSPSVITAKYHSRGLSHIEVYAAILLPTSVFASFAGVTTVIMVIICYRRKKTKQSGISTAKNASYFGMSIIEGKMPEEENQSQVTPQEPVYSNITCPSKESSRNHYQTSQPSMTDDPIYNNIISSLN